MDTKQRFIGSLRGAILAHTAGKELGRDRQTQQFLSKLNGLIADYEADCLGGSAIDGLVRRVARDPSVRELIRPAPAVRAIRLLGQRGAGWGSGTKMMRTWQTVGLPHLRLPNHSKQYPARPSLFSSQRVNVAEVHVDDPSWNKGRVLIAWIAVEPGPKITTNANPTARPNFCQAFVGPEERTVLTVPEPVDVVSIVEFGMNAQHPLQDVDGLLRVLLSVCDSDENG